MKIKSFLHRHPLMLCGKDDTDVRRAAVCEGCGQKIHDLSCSCNVCGFHLHQSCADLQQERTSYELHRCPLILEISPGFSCEICHLSSNGFTYHCARCGFNVHVKCFIDFVKRNKKFSHFSHAHGLSVDSHRNEKMRDSCSFCEQLVSDNCYCSCDDCRDFLIHSWCIKNLVSQEIPYASHASCGPLRLLPLPLSYTCSECEENCTQILAFSCRSCKFKLCGVCYMMPLIKASDGSIQRQEFAGCVWLLRDIEKELVGSFKCQVCEEPCFGPNYVCKRFGYVHQSCTQKIPLRIDEHCYHPQHPLFLRCSEEAIRCRLCLNRTRKFSYFCVDAGCANKDSYFTLDIKCAFLRPSIQYEGHHHPLTFVHSFGYNLEIICDYCQNWCSFDDSHVFYCSMCRLVFHFECGPWPCTIKHESHVHPLILTKFFIDEDRDDFCCHVCEGRRDLNSWVYCCPDCPFIAEIVCVFSEISATLRGERGHVKLMTSTKNEEYEMLGETRKFELIVRNELDVKEKGVQAKTSSSSLRDILGSMEDADKKEWDCLIRLVGMASKGGDANASSSDYLDAGYRNLTGRRLPEWKCISLKDFFEQYEDEDFVAHGNYMVVQCMLPSFKILLARYGDIGAKSKLKHVVKSLCLFVMLDYFQFVFELSQSERVPELTPDWKPFEKFATNAGLTTLFIKEYAEWIMLCSYSLRIERIMNDAYLALGLECTDISVQIQTLNERRERAKLKFQQIKTSTTELAKENGLFNSSTYKSKARQLKLLLK